MTATATPAKFIVLHQGLGPFEQGDVITEIDACGGLDRDNNPIMTPQERFKNIRRLLEIHAVREANDFESTQTRVTVTHDDRRRHSLEQMLQDRDQIIGELQARMQQQAAEITAYKRMATAPSQIAVQAVENQQTMALISEKDKMIAEMQATLQRQAQQLAEIASQQPPLPQGAAAQVTKKK